MGRNGTRSGLYLFLVFILLLGAAGCVRRAGRNAECRWPSETLPHAATPRHLSADAEFAEDLAIRYADAHYSLRTPNYVPGERYGAARDQCMQALFGQAAKQHGVPVALVASSLGRNRGYIDLGENLPFLLLYCLAAAAVARMNWRRHPPEEQGRAPGAIMAVFLSVVFAAGGTMAGEIWASAAETLRVGNGHLSYRGQRLLWNQHRGVLFALALIIFWLAVMEAARHVRLGMSGVVRS